MLHLDESKSSATETDNLDNEGISIGLTGLLDDKLFDSDSDGDVDWVAEKNMDGIINQQR